VPTIFSSDKSSPGLTEGFDLSDQPQEWITAGAVESMAAGVAHRLRDIGDLVELVEAAELKPGKRGPYKKHVIEPAH